MTSLPKNPIVQFKHHQLIHRQHNDYIQVKQEINNKPFLLFLIGIPADIGVMVALLALFKQAITMAGVPLAVVFGLIFAILCLFSNNIGSFILQFKMINTKQQKTNRATKKSFGTVDWIVICALSILGCLLFYFYVYAKFPVNSYELNSLKFAILIIAMPYYVYRTIKLFTTLFT